MKKATKSIILLFSIVFAACDDNTLQVKKSRVVYLEYGKYEDSVTAFLHGKVFEEDTTSFLKDSLMPLPGVNIYIESEAPGFLKAYSTDTIGVFVIPLIKGTYNLNFKKNGYQPLKIIDYLSNPDYSATTKIILVKEE